MIWTPTPEGFKLLRDPRVDGYPQGHKQVRGYSSRASFRFPQCVSLRSGLNTRSQPRLSIVVSGWRESQFFRRQRPVNRPLGFCHGLGFGGSSPPYGNACVERDRPFPHVPSNALNDAILDAAIFHVVKHTFAKAAREGLAIVAN
jgi:hypothetical protein